MLAFAAGHLRHLDAIRPLDFERRRREKERSREIGPSIRCRPGRSPRCRQGARASRKARPTTCLLDTTASTAPAMVVRKPSVGKREMRRMPDSPRGQLRPVVGLADAERGDHAHAGHATTGRPFLSRRCGRPYRSPSTGRSARLHALDQREAFAAPVADAGDDRLRQIRGGLAIRSPPYPSGGNSLPCSTASQPIAILARNCVSIPLPI